MISVLQFQPTTHAPVAMFRDQHKMESRSELLICLVIVDRDVLVNVSGVSGLKFGHDFAYTKFDYASWFFSDVKRK